ncbi:MAG TPA: hypothetical protein VLE47_02605 [Candidatus Saccharimonadales bacterium]|nr:hypothetical protein [Candidatus Saccharimonadales bacterium]
MKLLMVVTVLCLSVTLLACSSKSKGEDQGGQTKVGVLVDTERNCSIPEGCGAKWQLLIGGYAKSEILSGDNLDSADSGYLVRVQGEQQEDNFVVKKYEKLSTITTNELSPKFFDEIRSQYPCYLNGGVVAGNVVISWTKDDGPVRFIYEITRPNGEKVRFVYDGDGNLIEQPSPTC